MRSTPTLTPGLEDDALGLHLLEPAVEVALLHLEVGDAVAEQAADPVVALEDGDGVPGPGELLGGGQPGRARADDRHRLAGLHLGRLRDDPAFVPGPVDDARLDLLDRDRVAVDPQDARRLARGRAELAGELGEVVRGVQPVDRRPPLVAVDQVVPVGDQVAERASLVAERDAAVHAPRALGPELLVGERVVDLEVVVNPLGTGRRVGVSRGISMNPVGLPTAHLHLLACSIAARAESSLPSSALRGRGGSRPA